MELIRYISTTTCNLSASTTIINRVGKVITITGVINCFPNSPTEIDNGYKRKRIFTIDDRFFIGFIVSKLIRKITTRS